MLLISSTLISEAKPPVGMLSSGEASLLAWVTAFPMYFVALWARLVCCHRHHIRFLCMIEEENWVRKRDQPLSQSELCLPKRAVGQEKSPLISTLWSGKVRFMLQAEIDNPVSHLAKEAASSVSSRSSSISQQAMFTRLVIIYLRDRVSYLKIGKRSLVNAMKS